MRKRGWRGKEMSLILKSKNSKLKMMNKTNDKSVLMS